MYTPQMIDSYNRHRAEELIRSSEPRGNTFRHVLGSALILLGETLRSAPQSARLRTST